MDEVLRREVAEGLDEIADALHNVVEHAGA